MNWVMSLFEPKINWSEIDKSCLVFSDHPTIDNGWIKGWVLDRGRVVVCSHSSPKIGNKIHIWLNGEKITRILIKVNIIDASDITICELDSPLPEGVAIYNVAGKHRKYQRIATFHQNKTFSLRRLIKRGEFLEGRYYEDHIIPGDSGLPWFLWDGEFKIISHNFKGDYGIGPDYTSYIEKFYS